MTALAGQIAARLDRSRVLRAPRGTDLNCKSWLTEAPYRMIQNNLDPEVAEKPEQLIVYGGIGRAARNWESYDKILELLKELDDDESLLVQSGKPVGVFKTHVDAPRVLIANSNLVPNWSNWEHFNELDRKGLMMYGQMTAGSWIYIGSQGIVQGTYETFVEAGRQHFDGAKTFRMVCPRDSLVSSHRCYSHPEFIGGVISRIYSQRLTLPVDPKRVTARDVSIEFEGCVT